MTNPKITGCRTGYDRPPIDKCEPRDDDDDTTTGITVSATTTAWARPPRTTTTARTTTTRATTATPGAPGAKVRAPADGKTDSRNNTRVGNRAARGVVLGRIGPIGFGR